MEAGTFLESICYVAIERGPRLVVRNARSAIERRVRRRAGDRSRPRAWSYVIAMW